ncbi:MAG TPA: diaminopimelate decarboxylase [Spirochaetes bacterium]|nr:diaminopimelate decarboxylase [Spirochaetota bacterium]
MKKHGEYFNFDGGQLRCDGVPVARLAGEFGTPLYVYTERGFSRRFTELSDALSGVENLICYSVKSNSNLSILRLMNGLGSGMDVVSGGELYRALRASVPASRIVFAGVGKTDEEILYAIDSSILMFNCESFPEIQAIERLSAARDRCTDIAIRVNPDVDANTHHYITTGKKENKFGISIEDLRDHYDFLGELKNTKLKGIHCHIGSQILEVEPFIAALDRVIAVIAELRENGFREVEYVNLGGGMGIRYKDEEPFSVEKWAELVKARIKPTGLRLIVEPGRYISGNNGILLVRVLYKKKSGSKTFLITDGGMNDLIRPSLYDAYQRIVNCEHRDGVETVDVVGPICESGDFFGKDREISTTEEGDLLAVMSSGAYGMAMASRYNSRRMPAEVMVTGSGEAMLVRRRDTLDELVSSELL